MTSLGERVARPSIQAPSLYRGRDGSTTKNKLPTLNLLCFIFWTTVLRIIGPIFPLRVIDRWARKWQRKSCACWMKGPIRLMICTYQHFFRNNDASSLFRIPSEFKLSMNCPIVTSSLFITAACSLSDFMLDFVAD